MTALDEKSTNCGSALTGVADKPDVVEAVLGDRGYVYDFGDYWEHRIIVEQAGNAKTGAKYPQFLGGERRCPPEDCGGPPEDCGGLPGYFEFIENIARKNSKKAKEALEWYGGPYDPDDIDQEQINVTLGRIANSYRPGRSKPVKR